MCVCVCVSYIAIGLVGVRTEMQGLCKVGRVDHPDLCHYTIFTNILIGQSTQKKLHVCKC